jgi:MFS family permease
MMSQRAAWTAVAVAALGYFVDVFDLILFSLVRVSSLKSLGLEGEQLLHDGVFLLNAQMIGMLLGGVLFGVWGDKKGRLSVLFGSILAYSVANILNGFVQSVPQYAILRFIAGLGLAGELGAGITLVSESLPKEKRGLGTTIVATVGVAGAVAGAIVTQYMDWRTSYFIAGGMGLLLLALRVAVFESGLYEKVSARADVAKGDLRMLFGSGKRLRRLVFCVLPGLPIWFVLGILVTFAPELGAVKGIDGLTANDAVLYVYIGFIAGDLGSGLFSQYLRSRKRVLLAFIAITTGLSAVFLLMPSAVELPLVKTLYVALGFGSGYWAVLVTVAAEQFGTNLRSTVATSVPNFVRGAVVPMTLSLNWLKPGLGLVGASLAVLAAVTVLALVSWSRLQESFSRDLDFLET